MGKEKILLTIILLFLVILSTNVLASTVRLTDTKIDYIPYREVVMGDQGIAYQMRITNIGDDARAYYLLPEVEAIKAIGTYKINPTDTLWIEAGQSKEVFLYISLEKSLTNRISIPVEVTTDDSSATVEFVARTIGPMNNDSNERGIVLEFFKTILTIIVIILIIIAMVSIVKKGQEKKQKRKSKKRKNDFDEDDIETYY